MADSDGEFVADNLSDDDYGDHQVTRGGDDGGAHGSRRGRDGRRRQNRREEAAWETVKRSWEQVGEGEDGRLTVTDFIEAEKRRRLLRDTTPLQRGIIRHLLLVLDMSFAMAAKDYLPNMYRVVMNYSIEFVREYFEQNPISQLGIVGMKDGIAVRISDMSGNPAEHIAKLRQWVDIEPQGNPSLQNALEMCRGALFHAPSHGTREVLIIYGALLSSDPGDIHDTIASLISDRIRVSIVGLAAQVAICSEICSKTNAGDETCYAVAKHDAHCRELMLNVTTPPVTRTREMNNASLLMMGFPSRSIDPKGTSVCACHNKPFREGYACTRCRTKVCRLPAECPACGLTLILSTHLARSYHHLFPLRNWVEVPWSKARSKTCFACLSPFPERRGKGSAVPPSGTIKIKIKGRDGVTGAKDPADDQAPAAPPSKGVSESGRYACQVCGNHFCIDCDVYAHEVVHNCPGCQSDTRAAQAAAGQMDVDGSANGNTQANGDMIVDS